MCFGLRIVVLRGGQWVGVRAQAVSCQPPAQHDGTLQGARSKQAERAERQRTQVTRRGPHRTPKILASHAGSIEHRVFDAMRAKDPGALARLLSEGAKLHPFPQDMLAAALKIANAYYAEEASKNPTFKKIYTAWSRFRGDEFQWFRVAELSYANFAFNNVK